MKRQMKGQIAFTLFCLVLSTGAESECPFDLAGDLNGDCRVDWLDIAVIAENWLVDCSKTPGHPVCRPRIEWQLETPMSTPRYSFTGGVIDGKIYVFGGKDSHGENLKSTEMFDPRTDTWTRRADNNHNAGYGVEELTSAVVDGKLYVFGAYGWSEWRAVSGTINFVEEYDPVSNAWRSRSPKPTTVSLAPSTVHDREIYIFGGNYYTAATDTDVYYRVVEAFTPSTNTWRSVTSIPRNVQLFSVATIGDKVYLMGGYLPDEDRMTGDVITFDFVTGRWDVDSCCPMVEGRMRAFPCSTAAPVIDGKIFLIGGMEGNLEMGVWASNKVDVYDPTTNTWSIRPPLRLSVHSHLSLLMDDRLYVIGGTMKALKTSFSAQY